MQAKTKVSPFEKRIHEIDLIRGFLIILVLLDHIFWCLQDYGLFWFGETHWLYQVFNWYWCCIPRQIVQPFAVLAFCFISGLSTSFSRNNWRKALIMLVFWAIIALGSNLIKYIAGLNGVTLDVRVEFNIIGCLTFCTLIYCFYQKRSWKGMLAAFLIAWLCSSYFVPFLRNGLYNVFGGTAEKAYRNGYSFYLPNVYLIPLWESVGQADYVPLFPAMLFFMGGVLVSVFFYREKKKSYFPRRNWERPICFVGRHTLIIYLSHFLIIRGIFMLITAISMHQFH